jgi:tetratricopeptide (TPR) repeat protein
MVLEPKRRLYSEEGGKPGLRDVDAGARAQKLHALGWSLYAGIPLGILVGSLLGHPLIGLVLGPLLLLAVVTWLSHMAGRGASTVYMPSGSSTPRKKEYSRARALEVRGEYLEAIREYEGAIAASPEVSEPYLRVARMYRDELREVDLAIHWFRRAQREADLSTGETIRTHRELAELFLHYRGERRRAAPELARLADGFPDTPDGRWARKELADIKEEMAQEARGEAEKPP